MARYDTLAIIKPENIEAKKVSNIEDLSFRVSVQPLQYRKSPITEIAKYTQRGLTVIKKPRIVFSTSCIVIYYTLIFSSFSYSSSYSFCLVCFEVYFF
jgi:hypothetical protein